MINENKTNKWKVAFFIMLFLNLTLALTLYGTYISEVSDKQDEQKCIDMCYDGYESELYDSYDYNPLTSLCECYKDGKVLLNKTIDRIKL